MTGDLKSIIFGTRCVIADTSAFFPDFWTERSFPREKDRDVLFWSFPWSKKSEVCDYGYLCAKIYQEIQLHVVFTNFEKKTVEYNTSSEATFIISNSLE